MKKWLLIGIVLLVALSGVLAGCAKGGGKEEQASGVIQVPEGPKIKVVFNGPPELAVNWEKLEVVGFQLHPIGTLTNISDQNIKFSEVVFVLDSEEKGFVSGRTMKPAEKMNITTGIVGYSENSKILEVEIRDFQKIGGSTTPTEPTMPAPTTPQPTTPEPTTAPGQTIFTEAPKNPQSPAEILTAFAFLCNAGEYSEAEKLLNPEELQKTQSRGGIKQVSQDFFQGRQLIKVELGEIEEFWGGEGVSIEPVTFFYSDGKKHVFETGFSLLKENGVWKIGGGGTAGILSPMPVWYSAPLIFTAAPTNPVY